MAEQLFSRPPNSLKSKINTVILMTKMTITLFDPLKSWTCKHEILLKAVIFTLWCCVQIDRWKGQSNRAVEVPLMKVLNEDLYNLDQFSVDYDCVIRLSFCMHLNVILYLHFISLAVFFDNSAIPMPTNLLFSLERFVNLNVLAPNSYGHCVVCFLC